VCLIILYRYSLSERAGSLKLFEVSASSGTLAAIVFRLTSREPLLSVDLGVCYMVTPPKMCASSSCKGRRWSELGRGPSWSESTAVLRLWQYTTRRIAVAEAGSSMLALSSNPGFAAVGLHLGSALSGKQDEGVGSRQGLLMAKSGTPASMSSRQGGSAGQGLSPGAC